jgi:hypothetical protein
MDDQERPDDKNKQEQVPDQDDAEVSSLITAAHNSAKELGLGVWKRVLELGIKLIGVKGLFFGVCTYFYFYHGDKVPMWVWVLSGLILVGGNYADILLDRMAK